jgi:hypothetical protein
METRMLTILVPRENAFEAMVGYIEILSRFELSDSELLVNLTETRNVLSISTSEQYSTGAQFLVRRIT